MVVRGGYIGEAGLARVATQISRGCPRTHACRLPRSRRLAGETPVVRGDSSATASTAHYGLGARSSQKRQAAVCLLGEALRTAAREAAAAAADGELAMAIEAAVRNNHARDLEPASGRSAPGPRSAIHRWRSGSPAPRPSPAPIESPQHPWP